MSPSAPSRELLDPDIPAEVRSGRRFPYATVGDYVALADISDRACRVYWLLRMHVNGKRGDDKAWPSQRTIAEILRLKSTNTIGPAISELVAIGAVDIDTVPTTSGRVNLYTVHEAPPDDHDGFERLADFYKDRDERAAARKAAKDAGQEASPPAEGSPRRRRRIGGKTAGQEASPLSGGSPLSEGEGHPSPGGDGSPLSGGSELPEVEEPEVRGEVAGPPDERPVPPEQPSNAPLHPNAPRKANPSMPPSLWCCSRHLALRLADPEVSIPACRECRAVREWCQQQIAAADAAAVREEQAEERRAADCTWCAEHEYVLDPETGAPLQPAVRCDHVTPPEVRIARIRDELARKATQVPTTDESRAAAIARGLAQAQAGVAARSSRPGVTTPDVPGVSTPATLAS